jgi:hypothetical protein
VIRPLARLFSLRSSRLCVESARSRCSGLSCAPSGQGRLRLGFAVTGRKTQRRGAEVPVRMTSGVSGLRRLHAFSVSWQACPLCTAIRQSLSFSARFLVRLQKPTSSFNSFNPFNSLAAAPPRCDFCASSRLLPFRVFRIFRGSICFPRIPYSLVKVPPPSDFCFQLSDFGFGTWRPLSSARVHGERERVAHLSYLPSRGLMQPCLHVRSGRRIRRPRSTLGLRNSGFPWRRSSP